MYKRNEALKFPLYVNFQTLQQASSILIVRIFDRVLGWQLLADEIV